MSFTNQNSILFQPPKLMSKTILTIAVCLLLAACSSRPYGSTNKIYKKQAQQYGQMLAQYPLRDSGADFVGTINFSMRKPNFVIIHHTAQNSCEETLKTFTRKNREVSAHYVICESGTVYHMLNDMLRAHHAGLSRWGAITDMNSCSIGIEIDNNGKEPFSDIQIQSLLTLLDRIKKTYNIPTSNFIGHADIAPGRKVDPSRFFPWKSLADKGFGQWYDTTNLTLPENFNSLEALRTIGYNTSKPQDAIQSYKIHFNAQDTAKQLTAEDEKIIFSLLEKFR